MSCVLKSMRCSGGGVQVATKQKAQPAQRHAVVQITRREVFLAIAGVPFMVSPISKAEPLRLNKEADPETSPLIQELLARSKANKAQYDKERLESYYRRNYKDYFDFEAGNIKRGGGQGISEETRKSILEWVEKNK